MGCCACGQDYPEAPPEKKPGLEYDERWDRYRFAELSKGSDGHSDVEPTRRKRILAVKMAGVKSAFKLRMRFGIHSGSDARAKNMVNLEPRVMTAEERSSSGLLSSIEKEKIRQWMNTINNPQQETMPLTRQEVSSSFCRSRVSLHTIYTQDDVELIRSASHSDVWVCNHNKK